MTTDPCPICLEDGLPPSEFVHLPCKHSICESCFTTFANLPEELRRCPYCRTTNNFNCPGCKKILLPGGGNHSLCRLKCFFTTAFYNCISNIHLVESFSKGVISCVIIHVLVFLLESWRYGVLFKYMTTYMFTCTLVGSLCYLVDVLCWLLFVRLIAPNFQMINYYIAGLVVCNTVIYILLRVVPYYPLSECYCNCINMVT